MKKKYIGVLTNTLVDLNNIRMTDEVIKDILNRQPQVPVTINFGGLEVGQAIGFSLNDDKALMCTFEVDDTRHKLAALIESMYIVPGLNNVKSHYEGRTQVIDEADLSEVSLSGLPANKYLRPIVIKGDKDESA